MKLLPEGKSRALSSLALAAAAASCAMAVKASYDLATMLGVFGTPALYLSLAKSTVPYGMPPLAVLLVNNMRAVFVFAFLFWSSAFALAAGVWLRREWARRGAVWTLYLLAAGFLLLLVYPWLAVPRPLIFWGVPVSPEFNAAVRGAAHLVRLLALVAGGVSLWWALALDRTALRREFL
ncbi:MAG: hypothetical protein HY952_03015 [Elusimicrobia bacterium]|nr:hypothetical protein [Elusimicrobiota bacterium]